MTLQIYFIILTCPSQVRFVYIMFVNGKCYIKLTKIWELVGQASQELHDFVIPSTELDYVAEKCVVSSQTDILCPIREIRNGVEKRKQKQKEYNKREWRRSLTEDMHSIHITIKTQSFWFQKLINNDLIISIAAKVNTDPFNASHRKLMCLLWNQWIVELMHA